MRITTYHNGIPKYIDIPTQVVDISYVHSLLSQANLDGKISDETFHEIDNKLYERTIDFDV